LFSEFELQAKVFYNDTAMKAKLLLLTILVALFIGFVGIKYFILDRQNTNGEIKIYSSPDASLFVNNIATGHTPYQATLKAGEYILKLIPQGEATSTASWEGKVNVYKNTLTYVNRELGSSDITSAGEILWVTKMDKSPSNPSLGEIEVETDPQGAIVYLDNDEKGIASLVLADVPKGSHEISVFMPGFFRRTQKINAEAGYKVHVSFKLAIDQSQTRPENPDANKLASPSAAPKKTLIEIKETPTGFLRVRSEASVNASESGQVKPGDKLELLDESGEWYKVRFGNNQEGWVFSQYAGKVSE
jgi:hypothetical protein